MTNSFPTFETKQRKCDNSLECKMDIAEPKSVFRILLERQIHLPPSSLTLGTMPFQKKNKTNLPPSCLARITLSKAHQTFLFFHQ